MRCDVFYRAEGFRAEGEENEKENDRGKKEKEKRKVEVLGGLRSEVFLRAEGFCWVFRTEFFGLN